MSDLVLERKSTKYDNKVFKKLQDLGDVRQRFVIPETNEPRQPKPKPNKATTVTVNNNVFGENDSITFKQEIEQTVARDEKCIKMMNMAVTHVRTYDSKETAIELMHRAYKTCTSVYNRRLITMATRNLKDAVKAERWALSKKRRRHVDQYTVEKNITAFFEKLNDAVISIRVEIEKRTNKLFNRVKTEYSVDLPIDIPESKTHIVTKANIVAHCASKPDIKHVRLEANLYLLENATVIGVNIRKAKSSYAKAEAIAKKRGATAYDKILSRPSKNIHWYLLLDFGVPITYATFSDLLQVSDAVDGEFNSYDEYVKIKEAKDKLKEQLKTRRLAEYRAQFEEDNKPLIEDIKRLKLKLSNLTDKRSKLTVELDGLTSFSEEQKGVSAKGIKYLEVFTKQFRDKKHFEEGIEYIEAVKLSVKQKIAAKTLYYDIRDVADRIGVMRSKIKFLEADMKKRKENYAMELGLVSMTKIMDID